MKTKTILLLTTLVFTALFGDAWARNIQAQEPSFSTLTPCQAAARGLAELVSVGRFPVAADEVVITGAVRSPQTLPLTQQRVTLMMLLASAGGLSQRATGQALILREVAGYDARERISIDVRAIRRGRAADLELKRGDIVYFSERCFFWEEPRPYQVPVRPNAPSLAREVKPQGRI